MTLTATATTAHSAASPKTKKTKTTTPNPCLNAPIEPHTVETAHYQVLFPFTPSNKQLTLYGQHHAHRLVKSKTGGFRFDDDALRELLRKHSDDPLYKLIAQYRELEKVGGTYLGGIRPSSDGRYREEFRNTPKTLRLAMRLLQLLPRPDKEEEQGRESLYNNIRGLFVAAPGHTLYARDFSGIEAKMVGYLANDRDFTRLAAVGIHDYVACNAVSAPANLSWSDGDLTTYFEEMKGRKERFNVRGSTLPYKVVRTGCKRAVYLSLYGGTPHRMVQVEPSIFPDVQTAKWYQDLVFSTFPSIPRWQWQTCEEAERKMFITSPTGFRLWYPDGVFSYTFDKEKGKWTKVYGEAAKECIAAGPQHLASTFMASALVEAFADEVLREWLRLTIHDEIMLEPALEKVDDVDQRLKTVMEQPLACCPLPAEWGMGSHLSVATESKRGTRWSEMR